MNGVNNDWLPVEAEAHQSWPPKNKKETVKLTNRERQRKKTKYIVIHKIAAEKYNKKLLTLELHHHTLDHIELVI